MFVLITNAVTPETYLPKLELVAQYGPVFFAKSLA